MGSWLPIRRVARRVRQENCIRNFVRALKQILALLAAVLATTVLLRQFPINNRVPACAGTTAANELRTVQTQALVPDVELPGGSWEDDDPLIGHTDSNYSDLDLPPQDSVNNQQQEDAKNADAGHKSSTSASAPTPVHHWGACWWDGAADYIPCLDTPTAMETKERHCPAEISPCVVPVQDGYKKPVRWPHSRRSIWYSNVPHDDGKRNQQNWMRVQRQGSYLRFPGAGADAISYIRFIEKTEPAIGWGNRTRVVLDIGCGIASFGGYLLDRDVLTMSFAPVDQDAAQTQLALERGIPAFMGALQSRRLPFTSKVYDMVHSARCLVGWHLDGSRRMLEVDRILRPGGYFVWSSPVVYQTGVDESAKVWRTVATQAAGMCWTLVARAVDSEQTRGVAVFQKSSTSDCLRSQPVTYPDTAFPPICSDDDDPDAAWYTPLELCQHRIPDPAKAWPREWPYRLNAADDVGLQRDTEVWVGVVQETYLRKMGGVVDWGSVRNVLDMRAGSSGFAAALVGRPVWVMNVVDPKEEAREERAKMAAIFERGLVGMYHDWCEPMSTFPMTYDLVHADHALGRLRRRCGGVDGVLLEVDRIVRPGGWIIVRDGEAFVRSEVEPVLTSLMWKRVYSHDWDQEQLLVMEKARLGLAPNNAGR